MRKYLRFLPSREYIFIVFLVVLVISIGLISSNISNIRDPRPQATTNSVTFTVSTSADDGYILHQSELWPPPVFFADTKAGTMANAKTIPTDTYATANSLVRWNTSSIPDNATINSASFTGKIAYKCNDESRSLTAEWYTAWPIDESDHTLNEQSTALSKPLSQINSSGSQTFSLSGISNVSKTGYTGLRFHISGGQPTGCNTLSFFTYDSGSSSSPKLNVTYTTPDPVPTASISADNTSIAYNTSTSIRWSSTDATSCSASGAWSGNKATSGSQSTGNLTSGKTYRISCTGAGGTSSTKSVTVNVGSKPPTSDPDPDPDLVLPPSSGEGTPQPPPPGGGLPTLPPPPASIPGVAAPIDPDIVNILKINLSIPFLLGNITSPLIVGGFVQDLELKPGLNNYEVDVRGAKFALGKTLNIQIGGNKALIKKLKIKTKAPKQPVKFGTLYLGDTNRDNKINEEDFQRYLDSISTQDESSDVNADGVVNSLDWAILIVNFGKNGSR